MALRTVCLYKANVGGPVSVLSCIQHQPSAIHSEPSMSPTLASQQRPNPSISSQTAQRGRFCRVKSCNSEVTTRFLSQAKCKATRDHCAALKLFFKRLSRDNFLLRASGWLQNGSKDRSSRNWQHLDLSIWIRPPSSQMSSFANGCWKRTIERQEKDVERFREDKEKLRDEETQQA